jgi:CheY-like chemotaxis protein
MPGMDGYESTAVIRRDPRFSAARLPIIAMTANAMVSDRRKAFEAGLNDYISKPVDVTRLADVLLKWIGHSLAEGETYPGSETFALHHAPAQPESAEDVLPATIDSIDLPGALARLDGNKKLYKKLLLMFRDGHAQTAQQIRQALEVNDIDLARRLAHTLKGVAGTIGAEELRVAAKAFETAFASGQAALYEPALQELEHRLAVVMASIAALS